MNKQESQMLKGVAILLMIFLHLFNQQTNVALCHNLLSIGGTPLVYILSRAANPVSFFLILGGYGLYRVYEKGDHHRWTRLIKLLLHYWVILVIFLTVGHILHPAGYPGNIPTIISNFTGFQCTYNGEMWFLFPYMVLSICSPYIFGVYKRFRASHIVATTLLIHLCTCYCISRYGKAYLYHNYWVYNPLLVFHLLFSFSLGAMAARTNFFEKLRATLCMRQYTSIIACGGIISLVVIDCTFKYNFFYAFGIITCLLLVKMPGVVAVTLRRLGDQSMNMWMIHTWFCYYLFHDFIYSFSYPVIIFAILTIISYLCSLVVNLLCTPVERLLMPRRQVAAKPVL